MNGMTSQIEVQKSITCKYLAYKYRQDSDFVYLRLPMVHIYIRCGNREITTDGLVDSGSTATFLPFEFVEVLELIDLKESSAVGAGGSFPTWLGKVDMLKVMKRREPFDTFRNIKVHIPKTEGAIPYVVLGRDSIFRHFDITFYENRKKITFTRYKL